MIPRQTRSPLASFLRVAMALASSLLAPAGVAHAQFSFELLHSFPSPTDGVNPGASLIQAADGNLYGTSVFGGSSACFGQGCGTVFRMAADGTGYTVLHTFTGDTTDGLHPQAALFQAADGNLYGTTETTVFRLDSDGANYTVVHVFSDPFDGVSPQAPLIQAADGNLYGTTYYGGFRCFEVSCGTVFKMAPDGTGYTVLHRFPGGANTSPANPKAALLEAADGNLYGVTSRDVRGCGSLFRIAPDGTDFAVVHQFANPDGCVPSGALIRAADGNLYGTTSAGGPGPGCNFSACGTIFRISPDGTGYTLLHAFTGGLEDGGGSHAGLIQSTDGSLYGTTSLGGGTTCFGGSIGCGAVFRITPDGGSYELLHTFDGPPTDGAHPEAALFLAADGNLYGTTYSGGAGCFGAGCGTIFQIAPDGTSYTILFRFNGNVTDGARPTAPLIQAADGDLYGTTSQTSGGAGTVFHLAPDGTRYTILHAFNGGPDDGADPEAAMIQAADGNLYGTTNRGGGSGCSGLGCGTVFRIATDGTGFTILHRFTDSDDGNRPRAALLQAADGNLYGTTSFGGGGSGCSAALGCGTVFGLAPDGSGYSILHVFTGGTDGGNPDAALIQGADGNLYGTTPEGGGACPGSGCGTVFQIFPDGGGYAILHAFTGAPMDGVQPNAALIQAADGNLYGTTRFGGSGCPPPSAGCGTVFRIGPGGTGETILHDFAGSPADGSGSFAALIQAADGNFYGTTNRGGDSSCDSGGCGTIFQMTADGTGFAILYAFTGGSDGANPPGALIQASDGNFYGTASSGLVGAGTIYRLVQDGTGSRK